MPFAQINDIQLYFEQSISPNADAPRLLFIGGTGGDLRIKPNILDSPLAQHFHLLAYDQRGLGQSDIPDGPYTMEQYADDASQLLSAVGWESAHVYGVSFGGMVAQHLAIRHAGNINKLVLACTSSGGHGRASYPLHRLTHLSDRKHFEFMMGISDIRDDLQWQQQNPEIIEKRWQYINAQRKQLAVREQSKTGAVNQLNARKCHDTSARLHNIHANTFICGGIYDGIAPPENLRALNTDIAGSTLKFYQGGHLFMLQDRTAMIDILEFLQED
ncbi:MAG: alpha/beta hydrolase [Oceanicoccus sp.]